MGERLPQTGNAVIHRVIVGDTRHIEAHLHEMSKAFGVGFE